MAQQWVKAAQREVRMGFVRKVYGILSIQLLLTVAIALPFQNLDRHKLQGHVWMLYVSTAVMVGALCVMLCCQQMLRKFPYNYIFLGLYTGAMGVTVGFASAMYTWQSVALAAGVTVLIFLAMTVYAWTSNHDFTGYGPYLFAFCMTLCAFGLVLSILSFCGVQIEWMYMLYDILSVLLFTFYIVFDTQMIIGGNHKVQFTIDDYAFASLMLYIDIIQIFLHLLRLFGQRR